MPADHSYRAGMRRHPALLLALAAPMVVASPAAALDVPAPPASGNVADHADLLTDEEERALNARIEEGNRSTDRARVAVLTVESLEGEDLEDFSRRVATEWGVGDAGKDNGVLVLHSEGDREVRLEVADGARQRIDDGDAEKVVDRMTDAFGDEDFAKGHTEGVDTLYELARGEEPFAWTPAEKAVAWAAGIGGGVLALVLGTLGVRSYRRVKAEDDREKELTRRLVREARAADPELPEPDDEEFAAFDRYRREHGTDPLPNGAAFSYGAWLPLYAANPTSMGAPEPTSGSSTSSFGGGSGFSGGGASGSY